MLQRDQLPFSSRNGIFNDYHQLVRKDKTTELELRKPTKAQSNNSERGSVLKMIGQDEQHIFASGIA